MSTIREIAVNFVPGIDKALVFFEIAGTEREFVFLQAKLEELVERKLDYEVFNGDASVIVLVQMMPQEAREATLLMLTEKSIIDLMVLFPRNNQKHPKTGNRCDEPRG